VEVVNQSISHDKFLSQVYSRFSDFTQKKEKNLQSRREQLLQEEMREVMAKPKLLTKNDMAYEPIHKRLDKIKEERAKKEKELKSKRELEINRE